MKNPLPSSTSRSRALGGPLDLLGGGRLPCRLLALSRQTEADGSVSPQTELAYNLTCTRQQSDICLSLPSHRQCGARHPLPGSPWLPARKRADFRTSSATSATRPRKRWRCVCAPHSAAEPKRAARGAGSSSEHQPPRSLPTAWPPARRRAAWRRSWSTSAESSTPRTRRAASTRTTRKSERASVRLARKRSA